MKRVSSPIKTFKLVLPAFGFKAFILAVGTLWLLSLTATYLAQILVSQEFPQWASGGLRLLASVTGFAGIAVIIFKSWGTLVRLALFLWSLVSKTETVELQGIDDKNETPPAELVDDDPLTIEMEKIVDRIEIDLEAYLNQLDKDSEEAGSLLSSLRTYCLTLVDLSEQFSLRAEHYIEQKSLLEEARAAIKEVLDGKSLDLDKVRELAGQIEDQIISQMLLSKAKEAGHWRSIREHISVEVGIMTRFEQANRNYGHRLIDQVTRLRKRAATAESKLQYQDTRRPILLSLKDLDRVTDTLQIQAGQTVDAPEIPASLSQARIPAMYSLPAAE